MRCPSTTGAYGGVTLQCWKEDGHPDRCASSKPGYTNLQWERGGRTMKANPNYEGPVLYDTCKHCQMGIEYNGTWWVKGTCQSTCPYAPKYGGTGEHEPGGVRVDLPVKPRGKSPAGLRLMRDDG